MTDNLPFSTLLQSWRPQPEKETIYTNIKKLKDGCIHLKAYLKISREKHFLLFQLMHSIIKIIEY